MQWRERKKKELRRPTGTNINNFSTVQRSGRFSVAVSGKLIVIKEMERIMILITHNMNEVPTRSSAEKLRQVGDNHVLLAINFAGHYRAMGGGERTISRQHFDVNGKKIIKFIISRVSNKHIACGLWMPGHNKFSFNNISSFLLLVDVIKHATGATTNEREERNNAHGSSAYDRCGINQLLCRLLNDVNSIIC